MEINLESYSIYIKPGVTDMRKRAETLSLMVRSEMNLNPQDKSIFIFCGKNHRRVTAIAWDGTGWLEISKRLNCGLGFKWPNDTEEKIEASWEEIIEMLKGGDPWRRFPHF